MPLKPTFLRSLVRMLAAATGLAATSVHAAAECRDVRPLGEYQQFTAIRGSGCYRLVESFDERQLSSFALGGRSSDGARALIEADGDAIELNLDGLSLSSATGAAGIVWPQPPGHTPHRLVIRNGNITLRDPDGNRSGSAVVAPEAAVMSVHNLRRYTPVPATFEHVEFLLENLHLHVGGIGVLLMGDGITIRHCTIEVEGENAIVVYGPHAVIEDNHIVYRYDNANPTYVPATYPTTPGHYPQVPAAIYLRAADGAIVRNNTIEVAGRVAAAGIALVDSPNARLEGNRFDGATQPYRLVGASGGLTFAGNRARGGFLRADKALPDEPVAPSPASAAASSTAP